MTRRPEHQAWGVWFVIVAAATVAATALAVLATTITLAILRAAGAAE